MEWRLEAVVSYHITTEIICYHREVDILKCIFLMRKKIISINISLKFVTKGVNK